MADFSQWIQQLVLAMGWEWFSTKALIEGATDIADDTLHVLVGPLLQLAVAALFRTSIARTGPWLVVLMLEIVNEISDLQFGHKPEYAPTADYGEAAKDMVLTLILPTILLAAARWFPSLFRESRRIARPDNDPAPGAPPPSPK